MTDIRLSNDEKNVLERTVNDKLIELLNKENTSAIEYQMIILNNILRKIK